MNKEEFNSVVEYLSSIWVGVHHCGKEIDINEELKGYGEGFTYCCYFYISNGAKSVYMDQLTIPDSFEYRTAFRNLVDLKDEIIQEHTWNDSAVGGFNDAVRMLQQGKQFA